jgi:heptosyltransferase-3
LKRLLIRPGAIGDFIVSLPALQWLKADYTEVWCASAMLPLAGFAERAVSLAASGIDRLGLVDAADVIERLRGFDEIHSWYGTNRPEFRESVALSRLPFCFYPALPVCSRLSASDYYLTQVNAPLGAFPRIPLRTNAKNSAIVLHPFSGSARKNWPMSRWLELASLLPLPVAWCRGPEDVLPGGVLDSVVMIPDLMELAQWIGGARAFIGNDSGITHLAAATGVQTIALFGETDPEVWAPRGEDVRLIRSQPLSALRAETVAEAVR